MATRIMKAFDFFGDMPGFTCLLLLVAAIMQSPRDWRDIVGMLSGISLGAICGLFIGIFIGWKYPPKESIVIPPWYKTAHLCAGSFAFWNILFAVFRRIWSTQP